jgi:hypothetical protein
VICTGLHTHSKVGLRSLLPLPTRAGSVNATVPYRGLHAVSNDDIRPERPTGDLRLVGSPPPGPEHDLCPVSPFGVCSHFARFDKISVLSQIAL